MARILLADDAAATRDLVRRALEADGHNVHVTQDGSEALECVEGSQKFDVLLSDVEMPLLDFFSHGGTLKSSWYGDCLPERDFPTLVDLHMQGRLPLEKFVTERIGLDDVEAAFDKMHQGTVLRSVVIV